MLIANRPSRLALPLLVALALTACDDRTAERRAFETQVAPVLESRCTSPVCHGVASGSEEAGDVVNWSLFFVDVDEDGHMLDLDAAYEAARVAIVTEAPDASPLLRKPLAAPWGGQPHFGGVDFASPDAADYLAIRDWVAMETEGGNDVEPLEGLELIFAETVEPALVSMGCMNANCHGLTAAVPYRLDPGVAGQLWTGASRHNYEVSLTMLSLDGDPSQSRLLRKSLPLHAGGIVHKGGNAAFLAGPGDPRYDAILDWACAEREARVGAPCAEADDPWPEGFVFVRGPVTPHHLMETDVWSPGTDIWHVALADDDVALAAPVNVTSSLHDAPADIRDPAAHPSADRVLFTMRRSPDEGHAIYELDLTTGAATQLTEHGGPLPGGGLWTDRDPVYGPDDHVWFVSTRDGRLADRGERLDADLYELDPTTGAVTQRTWTPHGERKPTFYVVGEEAGGEVCFTALRDALGDDVRAHPFRFPPGLKTEYHQHFGITPPENLFHDMRETADGRYVALVGDLSNAWPAGRLGVIDRNFGPEIPPDAPYSAPGLPFYAAPLTRLDALASEHGLTGRAWRDPAPLADGRLLAAATTGEFDLSDPTISPDLAIVVATLEERVDGGGPQLADIAVLVDEPGVADYDPEPLFRRLPPRQKAQAAWDAEATTGVLHHNGVAMIDALLSNLPPSGPKAARDDIVAVRVVEALEATPDQREPVPPEDTRDGHLGATSSSLGTKAPARVLAELDLAPDGTFQAEIPAGLPFRLQALDATGMTVGTLHNRWFYLAPGQTMPQGTSHLHQGTYDTRCAGCHGAADGDPGHAFAEPDVVSTASLTLSRYEDQNPRRPIAPPLLGDGTRLTVDYRADVQPILDARCATSGCHDAKTGAGDLTLTATPTAWFNDSYETLHAPGDGSIGGLQWLDESRGSARGSHLFEVLLGEELDAPGDLTKQGQAHPGGLSDDELTTLIRWVELGATFIGTPDPTP